MSILTLLRPLHAHIHALLYLHLRPRISINLLDPSKHHHPCLQENPPKAKVHNQQYSRYRVARRVPTSQIRALVNLRAHLLSWPSSYVNSGAALMSSIPKPIASMKNTTDAEVCTQSAHPYLILLPLLKGNTTGALRFPVLKSPRLMRATDIQGVGYKAAFEGTASARLDEATPHNDGLPPSLCLSKKHATSRKNRQARVSFDIDSTCCFPQSLGFARRGIEWFPKAHPVLNLTGDIHFGLKVPGSTIKDNPSLRYVPLHKISHYSFGRVVGKSDLLMLFFFPALQKGSDCEHTSYFSKRDEQLWLDDILLPYITKVIKSSNILLNYPASSRIADLASMAISAESLKRKESANQLLVAHTIQPRYLDELWTLVGRTIDENPGFYRFQGATLFTHSKNTKLATNDSTSLVEACNGWKRQWLDAADLEFYNPDRTFVDIAKQITSQDSALPYLYFTEVVPLLLWATQPYSVRFNPKNGTRLAEQY